MNFSSNKKNPTITFDRRLFDEKVCKLLDVGGCGEDEYDKNYQPSPSAILSLIETSILNERKKNREELTRKLKNNSRRINFETRRDTAFKKKLEPSPIQAKAITPGGIAVAVPLEEGLPLPVTPIQVRNITTSRNRTTSRQRIPTPRTPTAVRNQRTARRRAINREEYFRRSNPMMAWMASGGKRLKKTRKRYQKKH